jgi:hypothetical protein
MFGNNTQQDSEKEGVATTKPKTIGRFRRRSLQPSQESDKRDEDTERRQSDSSAVTRERVPTDDSSSFLNGDKRQMKIVFRRFGVDPKDVLETVTEDIPEPASDRDVVIKIVVRTNRRCARLL